LHPLPHVAGESQGQETSALRRSVSVILCTHNPRHDYLQRAFGALRLQTLALEQWEFLFIDNASNERLADIWDLSWHPRGRHFREDKLGLTHARLCGIGESRGELLIFLDDDNLLAPDFLEQATDILARYPYIGVFGAGTLTPEFEVQPPPELIPRLSLLALRSVSAELWSNNAKDFSCIPWGAGLCVTRRVANAFRQLVERLNVTEVLGRRGQQLFCGEDDFFSWASIAGGQGFGIFPELRITHLISAGRLNQRYFLRLIGDHAFSHGVLDYLLWGIQPQCVGLVRYVHLLLHGLKNGLFSMRCQWVAFRGQERAARLIAKNQLKAIQMAALSDINPVLIRDKAN
jgi:glycosyltransferase involved in cell wall biosynthesis